MRQLRQDRRWQATDDAVMEAEQELGKLLREWHAALAQLHKDDQRKDR